MVTIEALRSTEKRWQAEQRSRAALIARLRIEADTLVGNILESTDEKEKQSARLRYGEVRKELEMAFAELQAIEVRLRDASGAVLARLNCPR